MTALTQHHASNSKPSLHPSECTYMQPPPSAPPTSHLDALHHSQRRLPGGAHANIERRGKVQQSPRVCAKLDGVWVSGAACTDGLSRGQAAGSRGACTAAETQRQAEQAVLTEDQGAAADPAY